MTTFLMFLGLLALTTWILIAALVAQAGRHLRFLRDIPPRNHSDCPRVSVVIPARDEERNLESAIRSLLQQDYPDVEFLAVDDRSTDDTGAILRRLARTDPRLHVITVRDLPHGWLGKNHALHLGAGRATGEFLLFTDADVVMHPLALRKAMSHVAAGRLDHLTVVPETTMPGPWLRVLAGTFGFGLLVLIQPWKMRDPGSRRHIGIGAFNLVRARTYHELGGHRAIAMRPDDDVKLAKLFKDHGCRQDVLLGRGMISVEWYTSVRDMVRGLTKITFSGVNYSASRVVLGTVPAVVFHIWPFIGPWVTTGAAQLIHSATAALIVCVFGVVLAAQGVRPYHAVLFPVAVLVLLYIQWKSMVVALHSGGITWRGTHYPLELLKANKV